MSPLSPSGRGERGWQVFNITALVVALAALVSLVIVLIAKWAGGEAWAALNFFAEIGLPIAFLMMGGSVLHSVARRRRL